MARISQLTIPTPYPVGDVNLYLVEDEKLTLIDTGAPTDEALNALENGLRTLGYEIRDVSEVIVTHFHPDHFGLAGYLARKAKIPVRMHSLDSYFLQEKKEDVEEVAKNWGLPRPLLDGVIKHKYRIPEKYLFGELNFRPLWHGEIIKTGEYEFKVFHTPGHSLGHVTLYELNNKYFFSGDFLIKNIFPNPLIYQVEGQRITTLPLFLKSLNNVLELPVEMVFPAHQDKFKDFPEIIERIKLHYLQKTLEIYDMLRQLKKGTLYEIAQNIYPREVQSQTYLVLSKVLGCLDLLVSTGLIKEKAGIYEINYAGGAEKNLLNERYFHLYKKDEEL